MFYDNFKRLCVSKGKSPSAVGLDIGIQKSTVTRWKQGSQPSPETLQKISAYFGVPAQQLLADSEPAPTNSEILSHLGIQAQAMLPIIGTIRAGYPIRAEENIEGWEPSNVRCPDQYFYLRVAGDSMIGAGITDGCLVLIHEQPTADNGQIVACIVNGDEATLKRFYQHGKTVTLLPENSAYEPIVLSARDFEEGYARIVGVAKQVVRDL